MCWWEYIDHTYACNVNIQIHAIPPEILVHTKSINKLFGVNQLSSHPRDVSLNFLRVQFFLYRAN